MWYSQFVPVPATLLFFALTLGCASEKKFVPERGVTKDDQIVDAFYASQPVREHRRLLIKTYLECARNLYDAKKENMKYEEENLIPYLEFHEYEGVIDLEACISILEEMRKRIIEPYDSQTIEYAKVLQLLLRCYFDQYYQGEGVFRYDTQDNIIEALKDFVKAREQNKNDLQWSQIAGEIKDMVADVISSEVAGNPMKEEMSEVNKWWLEHQ
jgi:hypothetical protein